MAEEIAVAKEEEVLDGLNNNRHKCMECFHMDIVQHTASALKCLQKNDGRNGQFFIQYENYLNIQIFECFDHWFNKYRQ
jgi:hypothetical protein